MARGAVVTVQTALRAVYVRGGTSRALIFHQADLPPAQPPHACAAWAPIFLSALGSPDPGGRQLDGLGGGISSLSKIAVVGPPTRPDADVDYTFVQVGVTEPTISYRGNCGNISSAIGPFAVDEGLVPVSGDEATVRIHNTNTGKVIESRFAVVDGRAAVAGDLAISGVAGSGAPIRLAFRDPGGAATGRLLPTGNARDALALGDGNSIDVSLVDAANPVVFVAAASLGVTANETPDALNADRALLARCEEIRIAAAVAMGIASEREARTTMKNMPLIAIVAAPSDPARADITVRAISAGQPHRAVPLTAAMCLAIAARVPGTLVAECITPARRDGGDVRVEHAAGVLLVAATVRTTADGIVADEAVVYRTARRLMQGDVLIP
jgi:2-methylaconitate cis-trans-isomerase PrpF